MAKEQKTELQQTIRETAGRLFLQYGLRSVSINDICRELSISKKTFYLNYSSKESLIEDVLAEHARKTSERMTNRIFTQKLPTEQPCIIDRLMAFSAIQMHRPSPQHDRLVFELNKYYPEIAHRHLQTVHNHQYAFFRESILQGIREGVFRDDMDTDLITEFITVQFMASIHHIFDHYNNTADKRSAMQLLVHVQLMALCNRKGLEYYFRRKQESEAAEHNCDQTQADRKTE